MAAQSPPKRRTFKEKLRDLVNEAEVVQAQALRAEQTQDVRSLATDLLVRGYPHAFSGRLMLRTPAREAIAGSSVFFQLQSFICLL